MEEAVGKIWHRWITRAAHPEYEEARVELKSVQKKVALYFHAFGGEPALTIKAASREEWRAKRSLLAKIAGQEWQVQLAWCDSEHLHLPASIALFPEIKLNEQLYLWLSALAANQIQDNQNENWLSRCQQQVQHTLSRWPGLKTVYTKLAQAHISQRHLSGSDALKQAEQTLRECILDPHCTDNLEADPRSLEPVPIWLHPIPPEEKAKRSTPPNNIEAETNTVIDVENKHARKAKHTDHNKSDEGLLAFRLESLFSWAEFVNVDRPHEDDEDLGAEKAANDLDEIAISNQSGQVKQRLKFDLDLPSSDYDDNLFHTEITTPEWDYKKQTLLEGYCNIQFMGIKNSEPTSLPAHLRKPVAHVRAFFEHLALNKQWLKQQPQGSEIDWDAYLDTVVRWKLGQRDADSGLFKEVQRHNRNLSCLLLADLSLSTEAAVDNEHCVIDIIRDGLFIMSEAMDATGDQYAIAGFSSKHRHHIRYYPMKNFKEALDNKVRGRIKAIRPGLYTRMGAAIRYATVELEKQKAPNRLLLLLSDGKPNDIDRYEGRYGLEDTRKAIQEATQKGIIPFCITIDNRANEYLPFLFGQKNYAVIRNVKQLPQKLPQLYANLTASL